LVGFSLLTAYSTSKFAVVGLSAAVGGELASSGVTVSCVCPSFVKSRLAETSGLEPAQRRDAQRVMNQLGIDADRVAKAIVRAARRGTPLVRVGAQAHALAYLQRLSPSGVSRWLSRLAERSAR
ncbi:MAG TPA: SDR family NAD(P)-dependent oxidoreductase, partial [Polyangiaceae bacterium]|nr:SDR family NAD(P)-dependent oxidoreductase [Polyangiaceae bacterium]